ncbi:hypothetical protein AMECASPLE_014647 [Ameca splendens]|uniref:Uncharacterized protein n=1 Tax=Ameca splendens TaxID=208324 RepID=A0ABV0ZAW5_9TELE
MQIITFLNEDFRKVDNISKPSRFQGGAKVVSLSPKKTNFLLSAVVGSGSVCPFLSLTRCPKCGNPKKLQKPNTSGLKQPKVQNWWTSTYLARCCSSLSQQMSL